MNSVLITGASTGIGEACTFHLAREGWRVFAGVRRETDARHLSKAAAGIMPLILDITKPNQISQAVKKNNKLVGKNGLQALVNNAGIAISGPLEFLPMSELRHQIEVNSLGQVELTQACLPMLRTGRGRVVNISSIGGRIVAPFLAPYSISKFALEAYSDGLRRELRPWKLYVTSVQAGSIDTPIWEKSLRKADQLRSSLPRRAEALYGPSMERARERAKDSAARGLPAEDVAHLVEHILTTPRPRARYAIGHGTRQALWLARWIPDGWLDWLMARVLYR